MRYCLSREYRGAAASEVSKRRPALVVKAAVGWASGELHLRAAAAWTVSSLFPAMPYEALSGCFPSTPGVPGFCGRNAKVG